MDKIIEPIDEICCRGSHFGEMNDKPNNPISFANFSKSYVDSAEHLIASIKTEKLSLGFNAPVYFLVAHALELNLKALLLECGKTDEEIIRYGHNIAELYLEAQKVDSASQVIKTAESGVRDYWKATLQNARDVYREKIESCTGNLDQNQQKEIGIHNNDTIGSQLPELWPAVRWFSELHLDDGSNFRYLKVGLQRRSVIRQFGLEEDVFPRTALQACRTIYSGIRYPKK